MCSSSTLSPAWIWKLRIARKLPWLPFGSSWTSGQSSRWPLKAIPWRPQKMTVSTIDLIFYRFSFIRCALSAFIQLSILSASHSITEMKLAASVTAHWWNLFPFWVWWIKHSLSFSLVFLKFVNGLTTRTPNSLNPHTSQTTHNNHHLEIQSTLTHYIC